MSLPNFIIEHRVVFLPDGGTAAKLDHVVATVDLINERMFTMAAADDLRREIQETKDIVASQAGKIDAVVQALADLKQALADALANGTGLTAAEVQQMAADLDAAQAAIAADDAKLDAAVAPTPTP